jgi:hypothetical protein
MGPVGVYEYPTTFDSYYYYDQAGLLVTVTRVAGSSGRVAVDYATVDGDPNAITDGDAPAVANTDYLPEFGTLVFDDFEMSKTILIPIVDDGGVSRPNRDFSVVLSNPRRDPVESSGKSNPQADISAPRVDSIFGRVQCRILDCDIDPDAGPTRSSLMVTNINPITLLTNVFTNIVYSYTPTNPVFNFSKANYRVPRDVQSNWYNNSPHTALVTIYVNRSGTNYANSVTVHYRFDGYFLEL